MEHGYDPNHLFKSRTQPQETKDTLREIPRTNGCATAVAAHGKEDTSLLSKSGLWPSALYFIHYVTCALYVIVLQSQRPGNGRALYESESMRRFAGLTITGALLGESTLLKFRLLLEKHKLGKKFFGEINGYGRGAE